jgi:hypothetical protein
MPLFLRRASREARILLSEKGINKLESVPVYLDLKDVHSGCFESPIKIGIAWPEGLRALADFDNCVRLMVHEYAHAALYQLWPRLSRKHRNTWEAVFGSYEDDPDIDPYPSTFDVLKSYFIAEDEDYDVKRYVSNYATVSAQEDWAETVTHFVFDDVSNTKHLRRKVTCIEAFVQLHNTLVSP